MVFEVDGVLPLALADVYQMMAIISAGDQRTNTEASTGGLNAASHSPEGLEGIRAAQMLNLRRGHSSASTYCLGAG
jgi:TPP-dependent pyruvate/acetoin dehydrogenase alpha subunit